MLHNLIAATVAIKYIANATNINTNISINTNTNAGINITNPCDPVRTACSSLVKKKSATRPGGNTAGSICSSSSDCWSVSAPVSSFLSERSRMRCDILSQDFFLCYSCNFGSDALAFTGTSHCQLATGKILRIKVQWVPFIFVYGHFLKLHVVTRRYSIVINQKLSRNIR